MTDFDALYQANPDPRSVASAWYERRKRAILMSALPRERYCRALELGCGTGETTRLLASRCDAIDAVDASATAMAQCRQTLCKDGLRNVRLDVIRLPHSWSVSEGEQPDLIVVAELAYYFSDLDLDCFLLQCARTLANEGDWLMCHYLRPFHDRRQDADKVHDKIGDLAGFARVVAHSDQDFRLDVWRKQERPAP